MLKAVTQTAPDVDIGWSRRRHASRRRSDGVRHKLVPEVGNQCFLFVRWTSRIKFFTLKTKAQMGQVHVQKFVRMKNMWVEILLLLVLLTQQYRIPWPVVQGKEDRLPLKALKIG